MDRGKPWATRRSIVGPSFHRAAVCLAVAGLALAGPAWSQVSRADGGSEAEALAPDKAADTTPPTISLDAETYRVTENTKALVLKVLRSGSKSSAVSVRLRTVDGTARAGSDYTGANLLVKIPKGKNKKKIKIPIARDNSSEISETFLVVLSDPTGEATLAAPLLGTVIIGGELPDPPLTALPGGDARVSLGQTALLAGSASGALGTLRFDWTLVSKPAGSGATLPSPTDATQRVSPDLAGEYVLSLVVRDPVRSSAPARVTLTVDELPEPEPVFVGVDEVSFSAAHRGEVDPASAIVVGFDGPIDPATLDDARVRLTRGGVPVPCTRRFDAELNELTLTPDAPLQFGSFYRLDVSGVGATQHPFEFASFTTTFQTPVEPLGLVAGQVIGAAREPLELVTVRCAGQTQLTDANGRFFFENVPLGPQDLFIETDTIVSDKIYTPMHYLIDVQGGATPTDIGGPIILTIIDRTGAVNVPGDVVLHNPNIPGLSIDWTGVVPRNPDGSLYAGEVSLSRVIPTDVPMPFPGPSPLYWTVQPGGLLLDPPAKISVPLPIRMTPGRQVDLWSFDHATNEWVNYAQATVNLDGITATSNPGQGLPFTGWGAVVTRTEVVRTIGTGNRKSVSGTVLDAHDNPLHGVAVTATGGAAVYSDYVVVNERIEFDGLLDGSYDFTSQLVGFNEEINGAFREFVPVPVLIKAFARDLAGNVYTAEEILDIESLADPSVPDGGLPDEISGPTLRITDYPVLKDGRLLLHEDGIRDDFSHVIRARPSADVISLSARYRQEVEALSKRLAAMGFRENDAGDFLLPTEIYRQSEPIRKAVRVFQAIWYGGGYGPRFQSASGVVDAEVLGAINAPQGVIWSTNAPFIGSNGYDYALNNRNRWFHATIPLKLAQLTRRTGINCGTRAVGGPRCLEGRCTTTDNHQAGGAIDMNMVATGGGQFAGSFYKCLKGTFDPGTNECTVPVSVSPQGVPDALEEWTDADRAGPLPDVDAAILGGRTWRTRPNYSRPLTQAHIDQIKSGTGAATVIYNDPAITGVSRVSNHHHHIHVNWLYAHGDEHATGTEGAPAYPLAPFPQAPADGFRIVDYEPNEIDAAVSPSANFFLVFSEPVDPATLTAESVRIVELNTGRRVSMARVLDVDGTRLELVPATDLAEGTAYVLRVSAAVESASGEPLDLGPFGDEDLSHFSTGIASSVVSAEFGSDAITLTRSDLSGIALRVLGRTQGGASRDLTAFLGDALVEGASSLVLGEAASGEGTLLRTFNGRSVLTALLDGPLSASIPVVAEILDVPEVASRLRVGQPVVARFGEPLDAGSLAFVSAAVQTTDNERLEGNASLSPDGRTVTFTPSGFLPSGRSLFLLVTVRVTDPVGRQLELVTASPFVAVGQVPDDVDSDGDGLSDNLERTLAPCVAPNNPDSDGDGVPDGEEDCDGDGLSNAIEVGLGIDPGSADTDGDGIDDRVELSAGCDPLVKQTAAVTGRIVAPDGNPVPGAEVAPQVARQRSTTSDAGGFFAFDEFPVCPEGRVVASTSIGDEIARGISGVVSAVPGGSFDAGEIEIRPLPFFLYPGPRFAAGGQPRKAIPADFDGDGTTDLLSVNGDARCAVLLGRGKGDFDAPIPVGPNVLVPDGAVGDVDGDGSADVVLIQGLSGGSIVSLLGNGDGTFEAPVTLTVTGRADEIVSGDLDGDGRSDLVVLSTVGSTRTVSVLLAIGAGTFGAQSVVTTGGFSALQGVTLADLDADGDRDLALGGTGLTILRGLGDGTFEPLPQFVFSEGLLGPTAADADADGTLDVVGMGRFGRSVVALHGRGDLTFEPPTVTSIDPRSSAFAPGVADLEADGTLDLAVATDFDGLGLLTGVGNGSFEPFRGVPAGSCCLRTPLPADWDRNGTTDLLVPLASDKSVGLLLGDGAGGFASERRATAGSAPRDAVLGDLDADGTLDAVVANVSSDDFSVLLGRGDGTFPPDVRVDAGCTQPSIVKLGDLDRDGDLDIVGVCGRQVTTARNVGDGSFAAGSAGSDLGDTVTAAALGDLSGDGTVDLAVSFGSAPPVLLRGDGAGSFGAPESFGGPNSTRHVAIGEVTGDGLADLVLHENTGRFSVMAGLGDGVLADPSPVSEGMPALSLRLVDVNGDRVLDVLAGSSGLFALLLGNGDGTFQPRISAPSDAIGGAVDVADVDLDGLNDILVTSGSSVGLSINHGDGTFGEPTFFGTGQSPDPVLAGDLDGDGLPDLFVPFNNNLDTISILLHR